MDKRDYRTFASILLLLSMILMAMPVRRIVIEVSEHGLRQLLVPALILVGLPALGAFIGAFLKFQGPGSRFFGIALGVFIGSVGLMALLAYWFYYSVTHI
ncbi:hypothetical protein FHS43_000075 [Streptosporangium becharense]|uniref:Uncharacterized protein n=1 Tax=Streptosporangium becharense TaxID=1816182 RepID=A0A7W9MH73_9ACTN|nr:hypothetical protein [Streptosporangium becharense]MBB2908829.1 hypothetical protein [Streptosporangium becharense]MBB5820153.1 hypothetical protein [Streptosporangium becharense]